MRLHKTCRRGKRYHIMLLLVVTEGSVTVSAVCRRAGNPFCHNSCNRGICTAMACGTGKPSSLMKSREVGAVALRAICVRLQHFVDMCCRVVEVAVAAETVDNSPSLAFCNSILNSDTRTRVAGRAG